MNSTLRTVFTATLWLAAGLACTHASAQRSTPVTVINDVANPIPVVTERELSPRTGFAHGFAVAFGQFTGIPTADRVAGDVFTAPADATLVLEQMTLSATTTETDQVGFVEIRFVSGGNSVRHSLPVPADVVSLPVPGSRKITNYSWPISVIADPGSEIILNLNSISGSPGGSARYTVSGYSVPAGSPSLRR